jgi:hypothetical protein
VDGRVKPGHDENDSFSKRLESPAKWAGFFGQALRMRAEQVARD